MIENVPMCIQKYTGDQGVGLVHLEAFLLLLVNPSHVVFHAGMSGKGLAASFCQAPAENRWTVGNGIGCRLRMSLFHSKTSPVEEASCYGTGEGLCTQLHVTTGNAKF